MSASIPGAHSKILARCLWTKHPATTTRFRSPRFLRSRASRMTSSDSSLLASRKPQVLTTIASGASSSLTNFNPSLAKSPSIFSLSTRFLGHPKLTKATRSIASLLILLILGIEPILTNPCLDFRRDKVPDVLARSQARPNLCCAQIDCFKGQNRLFPMLAILAQSRKFLVKLG